MAGNNEGKIALVMILALIAFVIGSAIGISVSIEEHEEALAPDDNNTTTVENVTVEMTSGINKTDDKIYYDDEKDNIDFNDNYTRKEYNLTD